MINKYLTTYLNLINENDQQLLMKVFINNCWQQIKEQFSNIKLSTKISLKSTPIITVSILTAPKTWFTEEFLNNPKTYFPFGIGSNLYNWTDKSIWINDDLVKNFVPILTELGAKKLTEILNIFNSAKIDNNFVQADYFNSNYYINLELGSQNIPLKII